MVHSIGFNFRCFELIFIPVQVGMVTVTFGADLENSLASNPDT